MREDNMGFFNPEHSEIPNPAEREKGSYHLSSDEASAQAGSGHRDLSLRFETLEKDLISVLSENQW